MKKAIAILFIVLVGLFVLEGCATSSQSTASSQQSPNQDTQKQQTQNMEDSKIRQPPPLPE